MARLTVADVQTLRANSAPLSTAIAPYISSELFKSTNAKSKVHSAQAQDHHFSLEARDFSGSSLNRSVDPINEDKVISLGIGRPNTELYPWEALTFTGTSPFHIGNSDQKSGDQVSMSQTVIKQGGGYDLATSLNYGHAVGSPQLIRFLTEHVEIVHNPPYRDWETCLSCGSTSAIEATLRILCNRGDTILTEGNTYPGLIEGASLVGVKIQGIDMDAEGIKPEHLCGILDTWDQCRGPKPRLLYMIPSGQNPTGVTQPPERRRTIYELAERYDLVIIEDDPYYFLHLGSSGYRPEMKSDVPRQIRNESTTYLSNLVPSYLSLDRSGRVVRLDSTSKTLAPGLRAGWITASAQIIDKFLCYQEFTTAAVSGPTQLMLYNLLDVSWGHQGFFAWLENLSLRYSCRLDALLRACENHLPKDICQWVPPHHGMFLWISLDWMKHPWFLSQTQGSQDDHQVFSQISKIESKIFVNALKHGVQVTKGSLFYANKYANHGLQFRLTFAAATEFEFNKAIEKFANAIKQEFSFPEE